MTTLEQLTPGMQLVYDGNKVYTVTDDVAHQFSAGDQLVFVRGFDAPIIIPKASIDLVDADIKAATNGFYALSQVSDDAINDFYDAFSRNLNDDAIWANIQAVNDEDVAAAKTKGRSTTRLIADDKCRNNMVAGLLDLASTGAAGIGHSRRNPRRLVG